jgi:hypothetical protein
MDGDRSTTNFFEHFPEEKETLDKLRTEIPGEFIFRNSQIKEALMRVPAKLGGLKVFVPYQIDYLVTEVFDLRMEEGLKKILDKFTKWYEDIGFITFGAINVPNIEDVQAEFPLIFPPKKAVPEPKAESEGLPNNADKQSDSPEIQGAAPSTKPIRHKQQPASAGKRGRPRLEAKTKMEDAPKFLKANPGLENMLKSCLRAREFSTTELGMWMYALYGLQETHLQDILPLLIQSNIITEVRRDQSQHPYFKLTKALTDSAV